MRRKTIYALAAVLAVVGAVIGGFQLAGTSQAQDSQPTTKDVTVTVPHDGGFADVTFTVPTEIRHGAKLLIPVKVEVNEAGSVAPHSIRVVYSLRPATGQQSSGRWNASLSGNTGPWTAQFEITDYPVGASEFRLTPDVNNGLWQTAETVLHVRHASASGDWRFINPDHVSRIDANFGEGTIIYYWGDRQIVSRKMTKHEQLSGTYHYGNARDGDHFSETVEGQFFAWEHIR